jgi:uncharacterized protein
LANGIFITRTPDGLSAYVLVSHLRAAEYPLREEILQELRNYDVVFGINGQTIDDMVAAMVINKQTLVAQGVPAQPGTDGHVEILVDVSAKGKPKELADGSVNFHDISYMINVHKGDVLARRVPPVPGTEGKSVLDTKILPPPPYEAHLKQGVGTIVLPADPDRLVAGIDGGLWIERDGTIEVHREKTISGDINYQTGDVQFTGDLTITGTVRAGFSVETKGSLLIGGSVEDSKIKCGGNLVIKGGAFSSGNGTIECKGTVRARHLEHFNVYADNDVVVHDDIVHGMVVGGKSVRARSIIGGMVAGAVAVEADLIGTEAEIKTVIDIGKKYEHMQLRYKLLARMANLTTEMGNNKESVFEFVRDSLADDGTLSYDNEQTLAVMKRKTVELHASYAATHAEIESLDHMKLDDYEPFVMAGTIFPNTLVKFGIGEQLLRERLLRVKLSPQKKGSVVMLRQEPANKG